MLFMGTDRRVGGVEVEQGLVLARRPQGRHARPLLGSKVVERCPARQREALSTPNTVRDELLSRRNGRNALAVLPSSDLVEWSIAMALPRRSFLRLAAGAAALPALSRMASAQAYPTRPITMIVPYPPGGPTETLGRIFAEGFRAALGQPVILESVGGAAGTIGTARAVRAAPDGYTINFSNVASHVFSAIVYRLSFDVLKALKPVPFLTNSPPLLLTRSTCAANSPRELIACLNANPNK